MELSTSHGPLTAIMKSPASWLRRGRKARRPPNTESLSPYWSLSSQSSVSQKKGLWPSWPNTLGAGGIVGQREWRSTEMNPPDEGPWGRAGDRQDELEFFLARETALGAKEMFSCLNEFNPQNYVKKQKQSQAWWRLLVISVQGR